MNNSLNKIVIKQRMNILISYLFASIGFVVAGVLLLYMNYEDYIKLFDNGIYMYYFFKMFAIIDIGFFGYGSLFFIKKIIENEPSIIVDEYGITDNTSSIAIGFISWDNIEDIFMVYYGGQNMIQVNLKNKIKNRSYIHIVLNVTGIAPEDFLQQLLEYKEKILKK